MNVIAIMIVMAMTGIAAAGGIPSPVPLGHHAAIGTAVAGNAEVPAFIRTRLQRWFLLPAAR
jgi:hypothetical protein